MIFLEYKKKLKTKVLFYHADKVWIIYTVSEGSNNYENQRYSLCMDEISDRMVRDGLVKTENSNVTSWGKGSSKKKIGNRTMSGSCRAETGMQEVEA